MKKVDKLHVVKAGAPGAPRVSDGPRKDVSESSYLVDPA